MVLYLNYLRIENLEPLVLLLLFVAILHQILPSLSRRCDLWQIQGSQVCEAIPDSATQNGAQHSSRLRSTICWTGQGNTVRRNRTQIGRQMGRQGWSRLIEYVGRKQKEKNKGDDKGDKPKAWDVLAQVWDYACKVLLRLIFDSILYHDHPMVPWRLVGCGQDTDLSQQGRPTTITDHQRCVTRLG